MDKWAFIKEKVVNLDQLKKLMKIWKLKGDTIVFTNGCFDILHEGHAFVLNKAASEGNRLIVGLNSDQSTQLLKGKTRPINGEESRALLLASMFFVDAVIIFDEETPLNLIQALLPDVLVKGGDYEVATVVGAKEVMENGGRVEIIPIVEGFSTTAIIEKSKK